MEIQPTKSIKPPTNFRILKTDEYVTLMGLKQVTSTMIKAPSSNTFSQNGLFSEEIFGAIGSEERLKLFGYIDLNCEMIQPEIYNNITSASNLYESILKGQTYAKFNIETNCFEKYFGDPEDDEEADTGYSFFLKYLKHLTFDDTGSNKRSSIIKIMEKYKDRLTCTKLIVFPAGLRDISLDDGGGLVQDDLNSTYNKIIAYTKSIPKNVKTRLYDTIRYNVQNQIQNVYMHFVNLLTGKTGFLKAHYGSRAIALGTRNVITATSFVTRRANDPQLLKPDETKIGIYQTLKGMVPLIKYGMNTYLLDQLSYKNPGILTIPLVNKKTFELENVDITEETKRKFTSPEGVESLINNFVNADMRANPIEIPTISPSKSHYLNLVYDLGSTIYYFRSISDLKERIPTVDKSKIRPLTWVEAFYIIAYNVSKNRHVQTTRYPVLGDLSTIFTKIHLCSTNPARVVDLKNIISLTSPGITFPEYPILGNSYMDTVSPSPFRLKGQGADYDGDQESINFSLSDNANIEIANHIKSKEYVLNVQQQFNHNITDTMNLALYNLSMY